MLTRTKPQEELGTRRCMKKTTQRKHSELKEPHEMLDKTKTLTTIARHMKAKEKALKLTSQTGKEPYKNHSENNRAYKMLKRTTKPLRRKKLEFR